jgi:GT2 family glycosyltransferase
MQIVISDNGSVDGSMVWVKNNYPEIVILQNSENLGWSGGNNVGIKFALEHNADYILLSNNDIYIESASVISTLIKNLEEFKDLNISIISPSVNYYSDKNRNHNKGWVVYKKWEKIGCYFNKYRKLNPIVLPEAFKYVDSADGCFMLFDSNVFRNVGLLREELFLYADEIDISLRAWAKGFKSIVNTEAVIYHKIGTTTVPSSPLSLYYRNRNLLILIKTHSYNFLYIMLYFKDVAVALLKNLFISGKPFKEKAIIQKAIFWGAWDGISNNLIKRY